MTPNQVRIFRAHEFIATQATRKVARSFRLSASEIEDVGQDALLWLAIAVEKWKGGENFAGFAWTVVYRAAIRSALALTQREELPELPRTEAVAEPSDSAILFREVMAALAPRMRAAALARRQNPDAADVDIYLAWKFGDASLYDIADERGCFQQVLHYRTKLMDRVFGEVAAELRTEAA